MSRPLHPEDARKNLRAYARRRQATEARVRALADELPQLIDTCRAAGLSMTEIARLAGVSRDTLYEHTRRGRRGA